MANQAFKYKVGMYGGCFCPVHQGHVSVLLKAAAECEKLYVVLSWSAKRDGIDCRIRYGWLRNLTKHLPNTVILTLEDECASKEEYDADEHWKAGADEIKSKIGEKIDAVYCSDEYDRPDSPYRKFYPDAELVFANRNLVPCSSTAIRNAPYANWDFIPDCVRPYYVKRVLVVGNESTGKSTLVKNLAEIFNTRCVLEYGRDVCERCGGEDGMTEKDFVEILNGHRARIDEAVLSANKVLFVDTDAVTTSYYASMNAAVPRDSILFKRDVMKAFSGDWDLILFTENDVPYVQDGLRVAERNVGTARDEHTNVLKKLYSDCGYRFETVSGTYGERLEKCAARVKELMKA